MCEKRDEFVERGLNANDALREAKHATAEEFHICSASMTRMVPSDETAEY